MRGIKSAVASVVVAATLAGPTVVTASDASASTTGGARRWLTTVEATGNQSLFGIVWRRHPSYTTRQVANEATATRNRFYPHLSIHTLIRRGTSVTIYV